MIPFPYVLRRRMMVSGGGDAPFAFEYTGNYTDNRDANGIGTVEFTSSGTLTVLSGKATVFAYILGAGGGAAVSYTQTSPAMYRKISGGGGGNQTVIVELVPGTYSIVVGTGGKGARGSGSTTRTGGTGGNTTAFGYTSTGGTGGQYKSGNLTAGVGGTPNGGNGSTSTSSTAMIAGGSPNGGAASSSSASAGGNGLVRLTFS